jgi:ATP-dependent protease Clp ATPase subunit
VSTGAPARGARARCSFCSKRDSAERTLLAARAGNVCTECLDVCLQILEDVASEPPAAPL